MSRVVIKKREATDKDYSYFLQSYQALQATSRNKQGYISLEKSESGFLIQGHSDHGVSKEPTNPLWVRIHRFLRYTQRNAPQVLASYAGVEMCDKPLTTSAWEATQVPDHFNYM